MKTLKRLISQLNDARQRLIFVSYPTRQSLDEAYKICRYWWGKGYIPLCPRIIFSYMSDDHDRPVIMLICKILICICGNFAIYGDSAGCREEHELAKRLSKMIFVLFEDDVNYKRMMQDNREVML
jgi:hypothetical protein